MSVTFWTKTDAGVVGLPFTGTTALAVLGAVLAIGGSYGGYTVYKNYQGYGANFDGREHVLIRIQDGERGVGPTRKTGPRLAGGMAKRFFSKKILLAYNIIL
jgi:hypothetical protein